MPRESAKTGVIYQIRDTVTGKVYVGSARYFSTRRGTHLRQLRRGVHHSILLQRAWDKRGEGAFVFEILERRIPSEDLLEREQHWMNTLRAADPRFGYNVAPVAGSPLGVKHTAETRRKFAEVQRRRHRERPMTEETRAKISASMKGNRNGAHIDWTPELRAKMSAIHAGREISDEWRAKLSEARRRRPPASEESRRKMSESHKRRYQALREATS